MPWTVDDPPPPARNWPDGAKTRCVEAANAALENGASEEQAVLACVHNAGVAEDEVGRRELERRGVSTRDPAYLRAAGLAAGLRFADGAGETLDRVEVFAVGVWNGLRFTERDLESIASTFETLRSVHRVPLKLGHNEEQPVTDGEPALGWVDAVWTAPGHDSKPKLFARFVDVPSIVRRAIEARRFRKVSIELDLDVEYKGRHYPYVLSGVALLGADLPAVSTLSDLDHYLPESGHLAAGRRAVFSAVRGEREDETMTLILARTRGEAVRSLLEHRGLTRGELAKRTGVVAERVDELCDDRPLNLGERRSTELLKRADETLEAGGELARFELVSFDDGKRDNDDGGETMTSEEKQEFERLKAENERLENERKEREAADRKTKIEAARKGVDEVLEAAVREERIQPAQRDALRTAFGVDDDERVVSVDLEAVKTAVGGGPGTARPGGERARSGGGGEPGDGSDEPGDTLTQKAYEIQAKSGGKVPFARALTMAMQADPSAAEEYQRGALGVDE